MKRIPALTLSLLATLAGTIAAHEKCILSGDVDEISLSAGGVQHLVIETSYDNDLYIMIGSASGTYPGFQLAPKATFDLNPDAYMNLFVAGKHPALAHGWGPTDGDGMGENAVVIPAGTSPSLAGLTLHHAFFRVDPATLYPTCASNSIGVTLVP